MLSLLSFLYSGGFSPAALKALNESALGEFGAILSAHVLVELAGVASFQFFIDQKMGWDSECRYKMLGYRITFEGETLYVFDLLVPEIFHEGQRKKNAVDSQDNAASTKPVNSRKGFYLDDIVGTFGVPVEEHRKESEVKQMDGYVSMGILTGKIAPEAGKD